ncbi:tyrosine-type recombinase/integrase [Martelella radicis]|uniref:Integrase n=1 Tax=Martelella radicis TaxID=1397476 RepID=A0A7W6P806_9HYPH|nr:tyrosine-type recombinase/integrase [Martelella radicis]MBB4120205.1 integrase [Martelella radicis]
MKQLRKPPKYCQGFVDRHGKTRWYFRKPGLKRTPLPGLPWTPEFMKAYEAAATGEPAEIAQGKTTPGTVSALVVSFYRSSDFTALSDSTKATYRGIIERFRVEHGDKRVAHLQRKHVQRIVSERAATPAAANNMLRMIHVLMRHAVDIGWRNDDPTSGVRKVRRNSVGFLTWEEEHIATFIKKHPHGTRAHLALSLLLFTGQRRSDVVRMGRQHIKDGWLSITQQKTGQLVTIPVHDQLAEIIDALPRDNLTFITTGQGKPFTPAGFTNWFREMVKEAGLPDGLSPHGLRKATCRRLAEAGCSPHEIMAISGHKSLSEVTRYTIAASRRDMAKKAMMTFNTKRASE